MKFLPGMLTRPEVDKAEVDAEGKSMRPRPRPILTWPMATLTRPRPMPKIALFFQPNFTF